MAEFTDDYFSKFDELTQIEYFIFYIKSKNRGFVYALDYKSAKFTEIKSGGDGFISNFIVYNTTLIFSIRERNEIYVSFNTGKTFSKNKFPYEVKEIFYSRLIKDKIVLRDIKNNVFFLKIDFFNPYFKLGMAISRYRFFGFYMVLFPINRNQVFNHYYTMKSDFLLL